MQPTPSCRHTVPTNVVADDASAETRYGETGLRERNRLAHLGLSTSRTPVVRGRDAELASIGVQLDRVRSGVAAVVLVEGEPCMGKTRLLAEADRVAGRLACRAVAATSTAARTASEAQAQVAEDVIDAEPNDALLDLVKGAYGSPFVFIELLSGLRDEDLIRVVAGRAELVEARLPRAGADRRLGVAGELPGRRRLVPGASAWQELSSLPKERQGPASGPAVEHARGHS